MAHELMDGELLRRDVMPAEIACPDGTVIRRARAFATTHRLIVWQEPARGEIEVVLDVELADPYSVPACRGTLSGNQRLECRTDQGTFWVNRGGGCGCGQVALEALGAPVPWTSREAA
jgi:hypothetical protein